jgi:hypothetical protein
LEKSVPLTAVGPALCAMFRELNSRNFAPVHETLRRFAKLVAPALVQTFGINATKRSGTLRGSCGENSIPDFWRPVVFDAKLSEFELTFPDPMHEFNAGDGDRGALKALQSEHWTQTKFDRPVILLDQIVIWHV